MKKPTKTFKPAKYPEGSVSQFFGENPTLYSRFGFKAHNGIDIVDEWDSPIYAVEGGTVVDVQRSPEGYGRHIRIITDGNNAFEWVYGHLEQQLVSVGDKVSEGQQIGTMGNTGFVVSDQAVKGFWGNSPVTTHPGTHLHLGCRRVTRTAQGWSYPKSRVKIQVIDYDNGYKGAIDPIPLLTNKKINEESLKTQISLLTKVVELLKNLKNIS